MKKKPIHILFEEALKENKGIIESSSFEFETKNLELLRKAKEGAEKLLDYGMQIIAALRFSEFKRSRFPANYLEEFHNMLVRFHAWADNPYYFNYLRKEDFKKLTARYYVVKSYYLLFTCGITMGEEEATFDFSSLLKIVKKHVGLDEVTALCVFSLSLLEIAINKKLVHLGEKTDGSFEERYKRLLEVAKQRERRELPMVIPQALYKVRNKVLHGGHKYIPSKSESKQIIKWIKGFITKLFE